jgi:hypothetical protein
VAKAMVSTSKEISTFPNKINILSSKSTSKEIGPIQGSLDLGIEMDAEFGEIGMGVLSEPRFPIMPQSPA